jgi:proline racemase
LEIIQKKDSKHTIRGGSIVRVRHVFHTVDTHTGGNPTRTILSGVPRIPGKTMAEKMLYMKNELDWIRQVLMYEPRGHDVMSGAILTEPCHPQADVGVIYIETGGYLPMCGHDTIGFCTALIETGTIAPTDTLTLDTPAGLVKTKLEVERGKVKSVTFRNVPAFYDRTVTVDVKRIGPVTCDIAYGGNYYAITDARPLGLKLLPENAHAIVECAVMIRRAINAQCEVVHPVNSFIRGVTHVEFFTDPANTNADVKNTVVVPPGGIDRSPCGTGTSAKLAVLFAKGEIAIGKQFVHESITGSLFCGKVLETVQVGDKAGVVTEISGSAWLTGTHQFVISENEELPNGFLLIPAMEHH